MGLGYVEKGVPSRLYGRVPEGSGKGLGNLTDDLTEPLTPDLTWVLTDGLTESRVAGVQAGWRGGQESTEITKCPMCESCPQYAVPPHTHR